MGSRSLRVISGTGCPGDNGGGCGVCDDSGISVTSAVIEGIG